MRSARLCPAPLPGFAGPKTYAAWPVWRDSTTDEVKFQPLPKKEAARRWHKARATSTGRPTRPGSTAGRSAAPRLQVLHVLMFDFLDYATGRLDPSYDAIARQGRRVPPHRRRRAAAAQGARLAPLAAPLPAGAGRQRRLPAGAGDERLCRRCRRRNGAATSSRRPAAAAGAGHMGRSPSPAPHDRAGGRGTRGQPGAHRTMFAVLEAIRATSSPVRWRASAGRSSAHKPRDLRECRCCQETLSHSLLI